jgi:transglutaminase-like putative cysteine protease
MTYLDENGMTLKEESPLGMSSVRVSEKEALADESDWTVDVLRLFAVPVDTLIAQPAKVRRVVLEVSGIDTAEFKLVSANQRIAGADEKGIRVEITVPEIPAGIRLPVAAEPEFLKPTVSIQSDEPVVRKKAQEIIGTGDDAVEAARKILSWVFGSLQKEAVASLPNALDVLKGMKGDCNEHSVVYAALCRAVGIPAKVAVGLVYLDGAFYYHAWNEVYLGRWVPVDATFGEFPASALRLKLSEGELSRQAEVLGVVRKIGIRVLEFD